MIDRSYLNYLRYITDYLCFQLILQISQPLPLKMWPASSLLVSCCSILSGYGSDFSLFPFCLLTSLLYFCSCLSFIINFFHLLLIHEFSLNSLIVLSFLLIPIYGAHFLKKIVNNLMILGSLSGRILRGLSWRWIAVERFIFASTTCLWAPKS